MKKIKQIVPKSEIKRIKAIANEFDNLAQTEKKLSKLGFSVLISVC